MLLLRCFTEVLPGGSRAKSTAIRVGNHAAMVAVRGTDDRNRQLTVMLTGPPSLEVSQDACD